MSNKIWIIILALSMTIVAVSGINVVRLSMEYQKGIKEYENLEKFVSVKKDVAEELEEVVAEKQEEVVEETVEESKIPVSIEVKYEQLKGINNDFVGWLYYEPLEISYPVVRGDDNDYYLKRTFENEKNNAGAIFMDFLNRKDYTDYNTIIYGHNMRNGTMFAPLQSLLDDQEIIKENPYFYIFTEGKAYMYEIFAVYVTAPNSKTYDLIDSEESRKELLDFIKETTVYQSDKEVTIDDRIVTLSTCHGLNSSNRVVVHGVLIAEEDR